LARFGKIPPTRLYKGGNIIYGEALMGSFRSEKLERRFFLSQSSACGSLDPNRKKFDIEELRKVYFNESVRSLWIDYLGKNEKFATEHTENTGIRF
jgi:hypothetical protein